MANWLRSKATCPISDVDRLWIERRWNWLESEFGGRALKATVVLPEPEFFPDPFNHSIDDATVLFGRVCQYMNVDPAATELNFYDEHRHANNVGFRNGTAGLYQERDGKHCIWLEVNNLADPLALVATMAHELAHVHLLGHRRVSDEEEDHEPLTDLLTVFFGLGVMTANSVIREKSWHEGQVSGWRIGRQGYLNMPQYGYALARFAITRGEANPAWASYLRLDVRTAFKSTLRYLAEATPDDSAPQSAPAGAPEVVSPAPTAVAEPAMPDMEAESSALSAEELLQQYSAGERDFRRVQLVGACLRAANLAGCNFRYADFSSSDLREAHLNDSNLKEAEFEECNLQRAHLRNADLREADFSWANLSMADLSGADIRGASFRGANLSKAVLVATIRDRSTDLSEADISRVFCDADLSRENLTGVTDAGAPFEHSLAIGRLWAKVVCIIAASSVGAVGGGFYGADIFGQEWGTIAAVVGAVLVGSLTILSLFLQSHLYSPRDGD